MLALISFIRRREENDGGLEDDYDDEGIDITMFKAGPGFTLPANIGDLDPAIAVLNLYNCNLTGELFR